ncbi:polysaccharide deacetylase family protein [Paenibacillus hexagrammi]|uniref:Polysaccharide deacetylase family protein n=1 Tax=Paenibacillus hexagrammi TaxID=2908839 RepID=A0ABY3SE94_9BACL|nr:polysaccharide deacetylase family protein [Paenibacillus sp. YPD9-1]UJF31516.1 polysaccharide deacetylase family protein [Paenibacillus sp. YPD9-1]
MLEWLLNGYSCQTYGPNQTTRGMTIIMKRWRMRSWQTLLLILVLGVAAIGVAQHVMTWSKPSTMEFQAEKVPAGASDAGGQQGGSEPAVQPSQQGGSGSAVLQEQQGGSGSAVLQEQQGGSGSAALPVQQGGNVITVLKPALPSINKAQTLSLTNVTPKTYYKNKVAVLTYHHLDSEESSVTITPERFKAHMDALKAYGFHVISIEDFIDFLQKKKSVPANAVVLTFDDGYESVYRYAYPILKSEGMPATVFLIVGYVEDGTARKPAILNWSEITEMKRNGFSFYSHTYNSHDTVVQKGKEYSQLTAKIVSSATNKLETDQEYRTRVRTDLEKADQILADKLGNKLNLLCLPHGQSNSEVNEIAAQVHIPYIFTGDDGFNTNKAKLIKRINAGSPYVTDKLLITRLTSGR